MVVNPPLGREIRRYPECAEKIREYMTCMNDQNSAGGVSRFAGSFISPCAPIQTEMNNCLVSARKSEQKGKSFHTTKTSKQSLPPLRLKLF